MLWFGLDKDHIVQSMLREYLSCCISVMSSANMVCDDVLFSPNLPDNREELLHYNQMEKLPQE